MSKKAIITSISNIKLTIKEKKLLKKYSPWGIILFRRNIKNYQQLKKLILSIRRVTKDKNYPILIDEEGGAVTRLYSIFSNKIFSQRFFGNLYEKNKIVGKNLYKYYINQLCIHFKDIGININTVPVLDKLYPFTNLFLKERIYSTKIDTIKSLSNICIKTYNKNKISTVIKHIPGHGLAKSDSHKKLPIVNKSIKYLLQNDFKCFKENKSKFAMTAHILFKKIDKDNCATHSKKVIKNFIRNKIRYKGILISDDISMKSLKHDVVKNALKAIEAGCNLTLYCKGNYKESLRLLEKVPKIDEFTKKKTSEFYKFLR